MFLSNSTPSNSTNEKYNEDGTEMSDTDYASEFQSETPLDADFFTEDATTQSMKIFITCKLLTLFKATS